MNTGQNESSVQQLEAQLPSEEQKRLASLFADIDNKQLEFLDEAGKSLVERISVFLAVLLGVTALGQNFPPLYLKGNMFAKGCIIATLICYLFALGSAIWAVQPRPYKWYSNNLTGMRNELQQMKAHKTGRLRAASIGFAVGSLALALLIVALIWNA